jgi:hypothetical protein
MNAMNVGELWDLVVGAVLARLYKVLALLRLRPNMNKVTQKVWVGGVNHPYFIVKKGFNAVVDLREKVDFKYGSFLQISRIKYFKRPTSEGFGIPPKDLLDTIEWIVAQVRIGAKVLIHCDLGRGRAVLVASSYLVYHGFDPKVAVSYVKKRRRIAYLNKSQRESLQAFAKMFKRVKLS